MIYFASWWSIREINMTVEISMLGRDAHMKVLNVKHAIVISHVILHVHRLLYLRECKCETMNPGPILIIRKHSSYFAAFIYLQFTLLASHLTIRNPPSPLASPIRITLYYLHHKNTKTIHCIFIFLFAFSSRFNYSIFTFSFALQFRSLTPCAWQPLGEVEGTKFSTCLQDPGGRLEDNCGNTGSPRVRYKPSSHPRGEKACTCYTLCAWSLNLASRPSKAFSGAVAGEP